MSRHRQYLTAFAESSREALKTNDDLALEAYNSLQPYICTDLSVEGVTDLAHYLAEYELQPVLTPTGEYTKGEEFPEFYMDEASLWDCVFKAFCK